MSAAIDVDDDTMQAIREVWLDNKVSDLSSVFGEPIQVGRLKSEQLYPNAQMKVELGSPHIVMTRGKRIDHRKVTITIRGFKGQVDESLPMVLGVFNRNTKIALPSGDKCMGWRPVGNGRKEQENATYEGRDIWMGIVEGEVLSVRSETSGWQLPTRRPD